MPQQGPDDAVIVDENKPKSSGRQMCFWATRKWIWQSESSNPDPTRRVKPPFSKSSRVRGISRCGDDNHGEMVVLRRRPPKSSGQQQLRFLIFIATSICFLAHHLALPKRVHWQQSRSQGQNASQITFSDTEISGNSFLLLDLVSSPDRAGSGSSHLPESETLSPVKVRSFIVELNVDVPVVSKSRDACPVFAFGDFPLFVFHAICLWLNALGSTQVVSSLIFFSYLNMKMKLINIYFNFF